MASEYIYPRVLTEHQTIDAIAAGRSIARYGDGELKLALGRNACAQKANPALQQCLIDILKTSNQDLLVGIPRIAPPNDAIMGHQKREFWTEYRKPQYTRMYDKNRVYASSFITRPDSAHEIDNAEYFQKVRNIWADRDVILINGDNKRFDKRPSIVSNAKSFARWEAPAQNAFDAYDELLPEAVKQPQTTLFLLAIGPTATVMAHELCTMGYQALDLGHFGMFYAHYTEN